MKRAEKKRRQAKREKTAQLNTITTGTKGNAESPQSSKALETKKILPTGPGVSYGKVPNAGVLPKRLGPRERTEQIIVDGNNLKDLPDSRYIITTQPFQIIDPRVAEDPDGYTECVLRTMETKRKIVSTPGFPSRIPRISPPGYRISDSPGMGLGMFATRDLRMGDFIGAERAFMISTLAIGLNGPVNNIGSYTEAELRQIVLADAEIRMTECFERMSPQRQEAYMKLANSHTEDGSGPISGRFRTNGFGVGPLREEGVTHGFYSGVCDELSRINHSCNPNVHVFFDLPTFCFQLRAVRSIKKDEELFVSYVAMLDAKEERLRSLGPYGITECFCECCARPEESDKLRRDLVEFGRKLVSMYDEWMQDLFLPHDYVIKPCLKWLKLIEASKLEASVWYLLFVKTTVNAAVALGDVYAAIGAGMILFQREQADKPAGIYRGGIKVWSPDSAYFRSLPGWNTRPGVVGGNLVELEELRNAGRAYELIGWMMRMAMEGSTASDS